MKKVISIILLTFLFIINVNAEVSVDYDTAMKTSQRYIYKFNKYDKTLAITITNIPLNKRIIFTFFLKFFKI